MSQHPEDRELEELMAEARAVRERYRAVEREEPSPHLDEAIRAAARRAAGSRPRLAGSPFSASWRIPLSIAAVLVVSATVTLMVGEQRRHVPEAEKPLPSAAPATPSPVPAAPSPEQSKPDATTETQAIRRNAAPDVAQPAAPTPQLQSKAKQAEEDRSRGGQARALAEAVRAGPRRGARARRAGGRGRLPRGQPERALGAAVADRDAAGRAGADRRRLSPSRTCSSTTSTGRSATAYDEIEHFVLYDFAVHWIDITRCWLAGKTVATVRALEYRTSGPAGRREGALGRVGRRRVRRRLERVIRSVGVARRAAGQPVLDPRHRGNDPRERPQGHRLRRARARRRGHRATRSRASGSRTASRGRWPSSAARSSRTVSRSTRRATTCSRCR